jgi:hypothetical protein
MIGPLAKNAVLYLSVASKFQTMQGIDDSKPAAPLEFAKKQQRKGGSDTVVHLKYTFNRGAFLRQPLREA